MLRMRSQKLYRAKRPPSPENLQLRKATQKKLYDGGNSRTRLPQVVASERVEALC